MDRLAVRAIATREVTSEEEFGEIGKLGLLGSNMAMPGVYCSSLWSCASMIALRLMQWCIHARNTQPANDHYPLHIRLCTSSILTTTTSRSCSRCRAGVVSSSRFVSVDSCVVVSFPDQSRLILLLFQSQSISSQPSHHLTHLRRRPNRPNHPLQQLHPRLLPRLSQPNAHIL